MTRGPWLAFDHGWFQDHQRPLLWLLACPLVGRWFRRVLGIRRGDVGYRGRIVALLPHAYTVANDDGTRTTSFRTSWAFSQQIYSAFRPLWWMLHAWDWTIADRLVPRLSCGFLTLTQYPDPDPETTTMDGVVVRITVDEPWATIRAGAGNSVNTTTQPSSAFAIQGSATTNQFEALQRSMFLFDTSSLGAAAVVSAAVLSLMGESKQDPLSAAPDLDIVGVAPASNIGGNTSDFGTFGSTSFTGAPVAYASLTVAGSYVTWPFDATGIAAVNTLGVTACGARNANYDVSGSTPPWVSGQASRWRCYFAEDADASKHPQLDVTYSYPPPGQALPPSVYTRTSAGAAANLRR